MKICLEEQIHRISYTPDTFKDLLSVIHEIYKHQLPIKWSLHYIDTEGDKILLCDQADYKAMLDTHPKDTIVKVFVVPTNNNNIIPALNDSVVKIEEIKNEESLDMICSTLPQKQETPQEKRVLQQIPSNVQKEDLSTKENMKIDPEKILPSQKANDWMGKSDNIQVKTHQQKAKLTPIQKIEQNIENTKEELARQDLNDNRRKKLVKDLKHFQGQLERKKQLNENKAQKSKKTSNKVLNSKKNTKSLRLQRISKMNYSFYDENSQEAVVKKVKLSDDNAGLVKGLQENKQGIDQLVTRWQDCFAIESGQIFKITANTKLRKTGVFLKSPVTDEALVTQIMDLIEMISNKSIPAIKNLALDLTCCDKITGDGITQIGAFISINLSTLEHLSLNFYAEPFDTKNGFNMEDKDIKQLGKDICNNLKSLKSFSLNFSGHTKITDIGITDLGLSIGTNLKGLEDLTLIFSECTSVTDHGVILLGTSIASHLINLKKLTLDFSK